MIKKKYDMQHRVLIIDDDLAVLDCIRLGLKGQTGFSAITTDDPARALRMIEEEEFSTVITDVAMPKVDGLMILKKVRERDEKIPVILITGSSDERLLREAIHLGVYEFLKKPFSISDFVVTLQQSLETYELRYQNEIYKTQLQRLVSEKTAELLETQVKLQKSYLNTIHAMVNAMEVNDVYTRGHSERVTALAIAIGKEIGLDSGDLSELRIGALLHDLGKIGVITTVLTKEQSLSDDEYQVVKMHPETGAKILGPIGFKDSIIRCIREHHEWYDGKGYPAGLSRDEIHLYARIVSVADSFDAMTSKRLYRENLDYEAAAREIYRNRERQFDPEVAKIFYERRESILAALRRHGAWDELLNLDV